MCALIFNSKYQLSFLIILFVLTTTGVPMAENKKSRQHTTAKKALVDSVNIERAPGSKKAVITLSGILPSPAFTVQPVEVKVHQDTVTITPFLCHDPHKIVIQVRKRFQKEITVNGLNPQKTYTVIVNGEKKLKQHRGATSSSRQH